MGEVEDNIHRLIEGGKWWIGTIDDEEPFAYTVGLYRLFQQPEAALTGLRSSAALGVLNAFGNKIQAGARYQTGERIPGILKGAVSIGIRTIVSKKTYREYLGYGLWFYGGDWFPVVQLVWPDKKGVLPLENGFEQELVNRQPLLP